MSDLVEKVAEALAKVPRLWLREIEDGGKWQVCHWSDPDTDEIVILATEEMLGEAELIMTKLIDEMRARAAIAVTIEVCAGVCDVSANRELEIAHASGEATNGAVRSAKHCAQAIRSLMEPGE